jgi:hypothetical protein
MAFVNQTSYLHRPLPPPDVAEQAEGADAGEREG